MASDNKTGFEKATSKMFGDFGPKVEIASPDAGGRLSREERERLRREAERADEMKVEERKDEERRKVLRDLVDMKVLRPEEASGGAQGEVAAEPAPKEAAQGRGRPPKNPGVTDYVLMSFRVEPAFRQRLKVMAAGQGRPVADLFDEAFGLLFEKYRVQ